MPYGDMLRYPRLGSRIRHMPKVSLLEQKASQQRDTRAAKGTLTGDLENQERVKRVPGKVSRRAGISLLIECLA